VKSLQLDLDVDASRKVEPHERVHRLRGRVDDVDCGERMTQYRLISVGSGTGPATCAPVRVTVSTILRADESTTSWS